MVWHNVDMPSNTLNTRFTARIIKAIAREARNLAVTKSEAVRVMVCKYLNIDPPARTGKGRGKALK